jgi:AraC-like DNA-binding protein
VEADLTQIPAALLLDLFLRALILGQLLLLAGLLIRGLVSSEKFFLLACGISVAAMVMLTTPLPEAHFGLLRNLLLVLTDAFPVLFWFLIRYLLDDDFQPLQWPWWLKSLLATLAIPYLYVLGVQAGASPLHDLIHASGMALILHAVYVAIHGFANDLLDTRRRARIWIVLIVSGYSLVLVMFELLDERLRNAIWYGLVNTSILLIAITATVGLLFTLTYSPVGRRTVESEILATAPNKDSDDELSTSGTKLQSRELALQKTLNEFVLQQRYKQNALTIAEMARQLDCPEHRLRRLINNTLGNRNFNSFLNDLRIPDACAQLADPTRNHLPILSIALSLGYDSIGPFNRAFKAHTGQPPSEYRLIVQNQR